jgi:hypothetical protein
MAKSTFLLFTLENNERIHQVVLGYYGLGFFLLKNPILGIEQFEWSLSIIFIGGKYTYGKKRKPKYGTYERKYWKS